MEEALFLGLNVERVGFWNGVLDGFFRCLGLVDF
jgi:hypothetical protein